MPSQNSEDAIIQDVFNKIGTTNKFFLEFGVGSDASECNTEQLRTKHGWKGVMWDLAAVANPDIGLYNETITRDNVLDLFEKYNVPIDFDFLSIDVDFNDWHMWREIGKKYRPRVVCIEYNFQFSPYDDVVVEYNPDGNPIYKEGGMWTSYQSASMLAMYKLAKYLGYSIVYSDEKGINLFFVRNDCDCSKFQFLNDVCAIYDITFLTRLQHDIIGYRNYKKHTEYTSARELLGLDHDDFSDDKHEYLRWYIPMRVFPDGRLQLPIGIDMRMYGNLGQHSRI
jgi:hypothetical protein